MIFTEWRGIAYRVHDPKWAYDPISGRGAGVHGGRANRPGVDALYLSMELETAIAEYKQLDALLPPALIVSYQISVSRIVDFRGGFNPLWDVLWQDFYCDWRKMIFSQGIQPPSWSIGDMVLAEQARGIIFKSLMTGGTNLVLYSNALTAIDSIAVHDPNHALPKNQDSWLQ